MNSSDHDDSDDDFWTLPRSKIFNPFDIDSDESNFT